MSLQAALAVGLDLVVELLVQLVDLVPRGGEVTGSGQRRAVGKVQVEVADLEGGGVVAHAVRVRPARPVWCSSSEICGWARAEA
jgi:hypothetical protein